MPQWVQGMRRPTRYPCRCKRCGKRRNLRMHPDEYVRPPRCCKRADWRVDTYRMTHEWHVRPCKCDEYSFPHARGRGYCTYNPAITIDDRQERWESGKWA